MKRYWKLISISVIIVLVIGTFYIQSSMASGSNPEFVFEKVSGNEQEIEGLTVFADFYKGNTGGAYLQISENGSVYNDGSTYVDRYQGINLSPELKRFIEDYRSFMRGKNLTPSYFYEDDKNIAYASIDWEHNGVRPSDFMFDISVLDKETEEDMSFKLEVPQTERVLNYVDIESVQIVQDQLKIITQNQSYDGKIPADIMEIHVYTIDIGEQKIGSDEIIVDSSEINPHQTIDVSMVGKNWDKVSSPTMNFVFKNVILEEVEINEWEYGLEEVESDIFVYNLGTNEQERLDLPEELNEANTETVNGSTIYFSRNLEETMEVMAYNYQSGEIEAEFSFDVPKNNELQESGEQTISYKIKNEKIYIVGTNKDSKTEAPITVADLKTGETLYEGKVAVENKEKLGSDYSLTIHDIEID